MPGLPSRPFIGLLDSILTQGRASGVFREVSPIVLHLMITGTSLLLKASAPIRERFTSLSPVRDIEAHPDFAPAAASLEDLICRAVCSND